MDQQKQYSTVLQALAALPDPRHARGKQLEWSFILGVIVSALLSQQRSVSAMAQWAKQHATPLITAFQPARGRVPSEATLRRTLRQLDVQALEQHLAALTSKKVAPTKAVAPTVLQGASVDGKYVRGAGTHGVPTLLVSVVQHAEGRVLMQHAAAPHQHETTAVAQLLTGHDLTGLVITLDAGLAHPGLMRQILQQHGDYLLVVKRNHARLHEEMTWFFDTPPLPCDQPWRIRTTLTKGHGRLEQRRLTCTDDLDHYLQWPGVQQVLRRECERTILKTGVTTTSVTYALTSVPACRTSAARLEQLWREHWVIENRVHYVRDVTFGEDAHQMRTGHAPQVLAAFRNVLLNVLRAAGWTNIAAALRHYSWSVAATLQFLGMAPR
jgi:predicted transposase YbfD/YdcC